MPDANHYTNQSLNEKLVEIIYSLGNVLIILITYIAFGSMFKVLYVKTNVLTWNDELW